MTLSEAVGALELNLLNLKEVVRCDFETRLRNQTGQGEEFRVGTLDTYDWKRDSPFMHITLKGSELGYIFPFQRVAFLFNNTAKSLVEPLSRVFLDSGYKPMVRGMWQEAYHIVQHEPEFKATACSIPSS